MSDTNSNNPNEKAAKIRRKPERESVLTPTFAVARQATPDRQQSHPPGGSLLQRQCSCGKHTIGGGVCEECQQKGETASPNALDDLNLAPPPDIQTTRDSTAHFNLSNIPAQTRFTANDQLLQPSLTVNAPGDQYEQEADRVAETVMRMPEPTPPSPSTEVDSVVQPTLSRLPDISPIQTSSDNGTFQAPTSVENRISQMQGNGQALPAEEQEFFEERMGYDFSHVRIHTDANAVQASRDIQAKAFTVGNNIAFNAGAYQPGSDAGRRLLAHELTHVVQQGVKKEVKPMGALEQPQQENINKAIQRQLIPYSDAPPEIRESDVTNDPDGLSPARLEDLFILYGAGWRLHRLPPSGAVYSREWVLGQAGTALIRGYIRSKLNTKIDRPRLQAWFLSRVERIRGANDRKSELKTMIDEAFARSEELGRSLAEETSPVLADVGHQGRTFSPRGMSRDGTRDLSHRIHAGMDVPGPIRTGIYTPLDGRVIFAGQMRGFGNIVRILHESPPPTEIGGEGPVTTNYAHLNELLVSEGDTVSAGQAVGLMGNTRRGSRGGVGGVTRAMGVHLHFSVQRVPPNGPGRFSSRYEERRDIRIQPDTWLGQLGVQITGVDDSTREEINDSSRSSSSQSVQPKLRTRNTFDLLGNGNSKLIQNPSLKTANPIQRAVEGCPTLTEAQIADRIHRNNTKEFRIDWVRNLQLELLGSRRSTDGNFDADTIRAIATFQAEHFDECGDVDGIIGANTRRTLEATYPPLLTTVTGSHLEPRQLVPGGISDDLKYDYYQSIIAEAGGHFLTGDHQMNLLGIRGIERREDGSIWQTSSARDFETARAAGQTDDHLKWTAHDDLMVSLWLEGDVKKVSERLGSVDPASAYPGTDRPGTAHLRDGQYRYQLGRHRTASPTHVTAVGSITDSDNIIDQREAGTDSQGRRRISYRALRPNRRQEVWRESRARGTNDLLLDAQEEAESQEAIYRGNRDYFASDFAINIHTSGIAHGNSVACQNVPADQYLEFMREISAASNQNNILYTLIDASKIESGLVLESSEPVEDPRSEIINPWADGPTSPSSEIINPWADELAQC